MSVSLIQANVGRARAAQDLLLQTIAEYGCTLGIVAEPNHVPEKHPCWAGDELGSVAITWRWWQGAPVCTLLESGRHYVAVRWGSTAVIGVYLPPSGTFANFETWLEDLEACIRRLQPLPTLVAGDFNSWSQTWGSRRTGVRGRALEEWAAALDLVLLNRGNTATCVRTQGESVIDLTWASPSAARMVRKWEVMTDVEHLSDHRYILVQLEISVITKNMRHRTEQRWTLRKLNEDALMASVTSAAWSRENEVREEDPLQEVEWLVEAMKRACDASMPRTKQKPRRSTYWWTEEIADLRREAIRHSRKVARSKGNMARRAEAMEGYREARRSLRTAIKSSKAKAWEELLQSLEEDPWGRPYKIVLNKLRPAAPPITETLDPEFVKEIIVTLFPEANREREDERCFGPAPQNQEWTDDLEVGIEELQKAIKRGFKGNTAPGPDGLHKKIWALASRILAEHIRQLFNSCLRRGVFPPTWRRAKLVLLRKEGKDAGLPSAYRPICLLDEAGKLFERVIANRLVQHLSQMGPNISGAQYGFREGLSTIDAIQRVRTLAEEVTSQWGVVLAVSLDISNAFNSLPWGRIKESLRWHGVPTYLVNIVSDYLRDRRITYTDRTGSVREGELYRGVPQGSVLGPLLWDLGYNVVLNTALPPGCNVVCYADDTLVMAGGRDWDEAITRGEVAAHSVIRSIQDAGLRVAANKTEALFFYEKIKGPPPPNLTLVVDTARISIGSQIKYLGLILDSGWNFQNHFIERARRIRERANALRGLLPNLGGASGRVRRLYANTVRSIALYGAPVWVKDLASNRKNKTRMEQAFHTVAIRVARAYRTVSRAAAAVLANLPPLELVAREYAQMYVDVHIIRGRGVRVTTAIRTRLRSRHRQTSLVEWKEMLAAPNTPGQRVIDAIQPILEEWTDRAWGGLSFRMTQIISGHGCFAAYLCRIGKEQTRECHHCDSLEDTAQHTLEICPAWADERAELVRVVGLDLSLSAIIKAILDSEDSWRTFSSFCERVMKKKEEAERDRRGQVPQTRRHQTNRRRRPRQMYV